MLLDLLDDFLYNISDVDTAHRILNTADNPIMILNKEFEKEVLEKYQILMNRSLSQIESALKARNGIASNPEEVAILLKNNVDNPNIVARVSVSHDNYPKFTGKDLA